ncbi:hypothetical protein FHS21_001357 [Phyllobacterium trifolii]|uniref:Uncharacterized protein n=1 Tax=Phyllobacterium trifolii TaxID=300193 RepID=A0A839U1V9_9HYPH|nr:hypothetical protein [Phyllobacterium trifolii]MBB3144956.1 hypothetical protein [Phyllobacterium trifolii]
MVQDLKSMSVWAKGVMALFAALAFYGAISLGIMVADRHPPISYVSAAAVGSEVPQGGSIEIEYEVVRSRICPSILKRWLVDSVGDRHAITNYTVGTGTRKGRETYRRSITIPDNAAVGRAHYEVSIEYTCNLVQRLGWPVKLTSPPIYFDITPGVTVVPFS